MSEAIDNVINAIQRGMSIRPKIGGFPFLAEALHQAGVKQNTWYLPSAQSMYSTDNGNVAYQGTPLLNGAVDIPVFNQEAVIRAIRIDQSGESTFPEFLQAVWGSFQEGTKFPRTPLQPFANLGCSQ
jgi:uncharacterized protein YbcV (DUF1398 family)